MATRATRRHTRSATPALAPRMVEPRPAADNGTHPTRAATSDRALHPTRNDLPAKTRAAISDILNNRLADLLDLYSQVKQAHWNLKGPGFHALHLFFDELADVVEDFADEVAERAVQLGGTARGTARMVAAASSLPEYPDKLFAQQRTLQTIADRLAAVAATVRSSINQADDLADKDTADLLTDVSRGIDKHLWFVESHLHPGG